MKKIYKSPSMLIMKVRCRHIIAESVEYNDSKTSTGTSGGWTKEDRGSRGGYNVWEDDWNK